MKLLLSIASFAIAAASVSAQQPVYAQCGGTGWTGGTTCVSGTKCTYSNAWYSQCLPSSTAPTTSANSGGGGGTSSGTWYSAVTTFNDYGAQSGVACSGFSPSNSQGSAYAAAMSDLSPLWTGSKCGGSINSSNCNGSGGCINCTGPSCAGNTICGKCFNVKCTGTLNGGSGSCSGNTIKVKIVDACPATHPENYCKLSQYGGNVPANQCCEASGINALDIATTARSALSSYPGNLQIQIQSTTC